MSKNRDFIIIVNPKCSVDYNFLEFRLLEGTVAQKE